MCVINCSTARERGMPFLHTSSAPLSSVGDRGTMRRLGKKAVPLSWQRATPMWCLTMMAALKVKSNRAASCAAG